MTWRYAAAKAQGISHIRDELPCQDAYACLTVPHGEATALIVAVSDGAGTAPEGAAGAAHICTTLAGLVATGLEQAPAGEAWLRDHVEQVRASLLREALGLDLPPRHFAATLLLAVLGPDWSAFAQVGDGAIVTSEPGTGEWSWLFWPQRGEYANTTTFLTDSSAMDNLEVAFLEHGQQELAVFTDGLQHLVLDYAAQAVHSPFFERIIQPVRLSEADGEDVELSSGLARYLSSDTVTGRADDDLTLVLATKLPAEDCAAIR